jgi:hypothetical protein
MMKVRNGIARLKPFSSTTNIYLSPSLSLQRLFLQKMAVLVNYFLQRLLNSGNFKNSLVGMRSAKDSKSGRVALIVANGPSAKDLNWEWITNFKKLKSLDVFLLNFSLLDSKSSRFSDLADYLVLSDPGMHPHNNSTKNLRLWEKISRNQNLTLISPTDWHASLKSNSCIENQCLHFNDLSLEGISNNISPLYGRGYSSLTAYKALSCAIHFGYKKIFIIGFDNSGFKEISVDSQLNLIQSPGHGLGDYGDSWNCTSHYPLGIGDFLYDYSELFLSLRRCFTGYEITNLGLKSEVDAFPKIRPDDDLFGLINGN